MDRRAFLHKGVALILAGGAGGYVMLRAIGPHRGHYFRPPGAGSESAFLSSCIRCARCVQACPYQALRSGSIGDGAAVGTPYLEFRETPCYMCEDVPCVRACPTDALDPQLNDVRDMVLGTAVIVDREACLSLQGIRCEICYRVCPLIDKAITLDRREQKITGRHTVFEPVVHKAVCTGCGVCEHSCPLDETAIAVIPSQRGNKAEHYHPLRERDGDGT